MECCLNLFGCVCFQEAEALLNSATGKVNLSGNLGSAALLLARDGKALKREALESAISPISSTDSGSRREGRNEPFDLCDPSARTCDMKDLVRKCLSEYKEWEQKLGAKNPDLVKEALDPLNCHLAPAGLADPVKERKEEAAAAAALLGKQSIKRGFELVDTSPSEQFTLVKKSNAEYKRGCKIPEIPPKQSTCLTAEINCLKLAGDGGLQETCTSEGQANNSSSTEHNRGGKPAIPFIAKNLMHDLNADCEKDGKKEHTSSSYLCIDDEKPLASLSVDSDLSLPEVFAAESHLEKHLSDLDGSIKEEMKSEVISVSSPCCSEASPRPDEDLQAIQESKQLHHKQDQGFKGVPEICADGHSSPSVEMLKVLNLFKKNMVAFRSYSSPINMSNTSEPSRISMLSVDGMDISACSGSYPMSVTPAQKGRPYKVYQVGINTDTWNVKMQHLHTKEIVYVEIISV